MTAAAPSLPLSHAIRQLASHLTTRQPLAPPRWATPAEAALFARMPPPDQLEGLAVLAELERWGHAGDRDLLVAGLLHDAGKSLAPPNARYRVLMTILEALVPGLRNNASQHAQAMPAVAHRRPAGSGDRSPQLAIPGNTRAQGRQAAPNPNGQSYAAGRGFGAGMLGAIRILASHAALGAELAAEAGLGQDVQRLIAGHHEPAQDARMHALQRADALH